MAEAARHHGITDGILQAFITGRKFPRPMIKYRVRLRYHHDAGLFSITQSTDGIVDLTALRFSDGLLVKKFYPDDAVFEELYRSKIKADTFKNFHILKVIYFLEESNFTKRFM